MKADQRLLTLLLAAGVAVQQIGIPG